MTHTPTPWKIERGSDEVSSDISNANGDWIVEYVDTKDAEFIVHAVNNIERLEKERDALLEAAKEINDVLQELLELDLPDINQFTNEIEWFRQAITQCRGGE